MVVIVASVGLLILSVVMASTAIWLMRANRREPAPLAPLEMMGDPTWQNADAVEQQMILDEVRPNPLREVARQPLPAELPESDDVTARSLEPLPVIVQNHATGTTPSGSALPDR